MSNENTAQTEDMKNPPDGPGEQRDREPCSLPLLRILYYSSALLSSSKEFCRQSFCFSAP